MVILPTILQMPVVKKVVRFLGKDFAARIVAVRSHVLPEIVMDFMFFGQFRRRKRNHCESLTPIDRWLLRVFLNQFKPILFTRI